MDVTQYDKMKLLELFAGTRSVGKEAEKLGFEVFSSDIEPYEGIDYVTDILQFNLDELPFRPTVIWASVPCTTYSILSVMHHRDGWRPKSESEKLSDKIAIKTLDIIKQLNQNTGT